MWLWLLSNVAGAHEYLLDPAETSITLDGLLTVGASEIDLTPKDYVITMELHNSGPSRLELLELVCARGKSTTPIVGERGHRIELMPGESRSLQLLCDHGREATGDPSLRIAEVRSIRPPASGTHADEGGTGSAVFKNVVWRMKETDITAGRLHAGTKLATGAFDRPVARGIAAPTAPAAVAAEAPLAIPAGGTADAPPASVTPAPSVTPAAPQRAPEAAPAEAPKPPPPPPPAATLRPSPG